MVALVQISTQEVLQNWGDAVPDVISIPGICEVHCPESNWSYGDYELIPVVYNQNPPDEFAMANGTSQAISNNQLVITTSYTEAILTDVQATLCSRIDARAEQIRLNYITPGAGQMGVYILKYNEALAVLANSSPVANNYPLNAASIGLPNVNTIQDAANLTVTTFQEWQGVAAIIENVRLSTKAAINAANSVTSAISAYDAVNWQGL
jgi:hypothetical protein